jgi:CRISPR system Cascade subunit CasA
MVFSQGWSRSRTLLPWRDAWVAYEMRPDRGTEGGVWLPIRPTDRPDSWRNVSRLFLRSARGRRPRLVDQIGVMVEEGLLPREAATTYETFGLRTDMKAKIFEWREDSFLVPNALLLCPAATERVGEGLSRADRAALALQRALRELHSRLGGARDPRTGMALDAYWTELGDVFGATLRDARLLGDVQAQSDWLRGWRQIVGDLAGRQLERALADADASADALRRQVCARRTFRRQLTGEGGGA